MGRYKIIKEVIKNQSNIEKKNEISELEFRKYRENNIKLDDKLFIPIKKNERLVYDVNNFNYYDRLVFQYHKKLLDEIFKIKYPDRNTIIDELLNIVPFLEDYQHAIIYKFDFKNFFPSLSVKSVIDKLDVHPQLMVQEFEFIKNNFNDKVLYPGLGIVNSFSEIIATEFDRRIRAHYKENLIYYSRYVDDAILILDQPFEEKDVKKVILEFAKKNISESIEFNDSKSRYFNIKEMAKNKDEIHIDFLGYKFTITDQRFKLGIAQSKLNKEKLKLQKIFEDFNNVNNFNLLKLRLDTYYKRITYYGPYHGKNEYTWQVRGISTTYGKLRPYVSFSNSHKSSKIDKETLDFLTGTSLKRISGEALKDCDRQTKRKVTNMLENHIKNSHYINLFVKNKAVLLNKDIGYTYNHLEKILSNTKVIESKANNLSYDELVQKYFETIFISL